MNGGVALPPGRARPPASMGWGRNWRWAITNRRTNSRRTHPIRLAAHSFVSRGLRNLDETIAKEYSRPVTDSELHRFFEDLVRELQSRGVVCAITSGRACVHYGIAETTQDCDPRCHPASFQTLLDLLQRTEAAGARCHYRDNIRPPLDARWHRGGWIRPALRSGCSAASRRAGIFGAGGSRAQDQVRVETFVCQSAERPRPRPLHCRVQVRPDGGRTVAAGGVDLAAGCGDMYQKLEPMKCAPLTYRRSAAGGTLDRPREIKREFHGRAFGEE